MTNLKVGKGDSFKLFRITVTELRGYEPTKNKSFMVEDYKMKVTVNDISE